MRGIKLQVRGLGQAMAGGAFAGGFAGDDLDNTTFQTIESQAASDPVVGLPDVESQVLLEQAHAWAHGWLSEYISDAIRTCPKIFALFSS
jgi:hypothetical protein